MYKTIQDQVKQLYENTNTCYMYTGMYSVLYTKQMLIQLL